MEIIAISLRLVSFQSRRPLFSHSQFERLKFNRIPSPNFKIPLQPGCWRVSSRRDVSSNSRKATPTSPPSLRKTAHPRTKCLSPRGMWCCTYWSGSCCPRYCLERASSHRSWRFATWTSLLSEFWKQILLFGDQYLVDSGVWGSILSFEKLFY